MDEVFKPFVVTKRVGSRVLPMIPVEIVDAEFVNRKVLIRVIKDLDAVTRDKVLRGLGLR